jgi:hypothetical protein
LKGTTILTTSHAMWPSQLERDLWIRALSIEIETHSREDKNHQEMLRYSGTVST